MGDGLPPALTLVELARATDTGRVRGHNEDRHLVSPPLLAVADGMGGARAGEVAAGMAVEALSGLGEEPAPDRLRQVVERANRDIRASAAADPSRAGMGTTMTAALVRDGRLDLVHVGDSRAYLWREGRLRRLTDDHSVVGEMVRRGALTAEQAERHPHRHVVTRALGAEDRVDVDTREVELRDGDVIMLCSDGLSGPVEESELASILAADGSLDDAARAMVEAANAAGGADNITVVLARVGTGEPAEVPAAVELPTSTRRMPTLPRPTVGPDAEPAPIPGRTGAPPAPRVLQEVDRGRSRRVPLLIAAIAALGIAIGALAWVGSRTYFVDEGDDGRVHVFHGLPVGLGDLKLYSEDQDTGVQAGAVRVSEPGTLGKDARGKGEATALAARLVWRYGIPADWHVLRAPLPRPAPPAAPEPTPPPAGDNPPAAPPSPTPGTSTGTTPATPATPRTTTTPAVR